MKRKSVYSSIFAFAAAGTFAVAAMAQNNKATPSSPQPEATQQPSGTAQQGAPPTAIVVEEAFVKHGNALFKIERVTKASKLEDLKADEKGKVTKDGKEIPLKEGEMVTSDGKVSPSPFEGSKQTPPPSGTHPGGGAGGATQTR